MKKHSVGNLGDWNFPTATKMKNRVIIIKIYLSRSLDSAGKYIYVMIQRCIYPQWLVVVGISQQSNIMTSTDCLPTSCSVLLRIFRVVVGFYIAFSAVYTVYT